jgi:Cyclin, N-terminal domain
LDIVTCIIIASKFIETDKFLPLIEDLISIVKFYFNEKLLYEDVVKNELLIMHALNWDLLKATVFSFIENYAI